MFRKTILTALAAAITFSAASSAANAGSFRGDGVTTIWVTIKAEPYEGLWQACRRVYQHDVYKVRGGPDVGLVRCNIDHSRIYR